MAKWNFKVNKSQTKDMTIESFTNKCLKHKSYCSFEVIHKIGLINKDRKCRELFSFVADCDGATGKHANLQEFLGILKIVDEDAKEIWFLWNSPGHEGDGIYGIEISDLWKKNKPSEEWIVYNGC